MTLYCYATTDDVYLLDDSNTIVASGKVTRDDLKEIVEGNLSIAEQRLTKGKEGIIYCNYKQDHTSLTDYKRLQAIIEATKHKAPKQDIFIDLTARKISQSVKWDTLLTQAIRSIEEIDKSINLLAKRLREWYEWHNPEFSRTIPSHEAFAEAIIGSDRDQLLKEINVAKENSMGAEFTQKDLEPVMSLASQIIQLKALRESTTVYIHEQMKINLPNFTAVAGAQVGAKLLGLVGSVERLVKMTSSTIQVLGAEKALFRHLKTGARPPKHGLLFQHPMVAKAKPGDRGKVARTLANTLSLSIRTDYFNPENRTFGVEKIKEIEQKFKGGAD